MKTLSVMIRKGYIGTGIDFTSDLYQDSNGAWMVWGLCADKFKTRREAEEAAETVYREACWQEALAEHDAAARKAGLV